MKMHLTGLILLLIQTAGFSQNNILDNPVIQEKVEKCLFSTYNYKFTEADVLQKEIEQMLPGHPATVFLKALILYWENFPVPVDSRLSEEFISLMEQSIHRADEILKKNPEDLEGIFFDLHARAFIAMFWADNGKPVKALKDIDNLYRRTMQGIDHKEEFKEFYFSSGLYKYYIEAYVELHPVYKPIAILFRKGNKTEGLNELLYAIDNTIYLKTEATLFMTLLQLYYEKDILTALNFAAILYSNFPDNTYFTGHYLMILLYHNDFNLAREVLQKFSQKKDPYAHMIFLVLRGFELENNMKDPVTAEINYRFGIAEAEKFGPFADTYQAIAYAGLSRIYQKKNNPALEKEYRKKSESYSRYNFILSYGQKTLL